MCRCDDGIVLVSVTCVVCGMCCVRDDRDDDATMADDRRCVLVVAGLCSCEFVFLRML
jgi:hypothetical protein